MKGRAEYCEFRDAKDENICDQVVEKCMSSRLRRKLLEKGRDLTLEQLATGKEGLFRTQATRKD